jgi:hypothetical protein
LRGIFGPLGFSGEALDAGLFDFFASKPLPYTTVIASVTFITFFIRNKSTDTTETGKRPNG